MSIYLIAIVGSLLCIVFYKRYFPVLGIPCEKFVQDKTNTVVLDIRDYNIEANHNQSDMRIPYAYLRRHIREIPHYQKLHVIANDRLELNLGLRYLLKKGYQIVSYQISNCPCRNKEWS